MIKIKGLTVALFTPFTGDRSIDVKSLESHLKFLISSGINNLYILGTTGEFLAMNIEERKFFAEKVLEIVDERINVFIHVGDDRLEDACELAQHAQKAGAAGVGAISPYYYTVDEKGLEYYYRSIAGSVDRDYAVYLYNLPACTTNDLTPEVVLNLSEIENIVGIKNSMNNIRRAYDLVDLLPDDFDVIQGEDTLIMPSLMYGVEGNVSGVANAFPEEYVSLYREFNQRNYENARDSQKRINQIIREMKNLPSLNYIKEALSLRGFQEIYSRPPLSELSSEEKLTLKNNLKEIIGQYPSLGE